MNKQQPNASVIIVNTNELHHLKRCLPAIARQHYENCQVLIIDNASVDGSLEYIAREFPWIEVIRNSSNLGYAGANNVGFQHATGDYIAVLNPDTEVEPGWLEELVDALQTNPVAGLATPRILMMDDPERINTCGNDITITGLTFCRGLDEPADRYDSLEIVSAVSGAAFVIKRAVLKEIGGFDESFFIYFEETDLSLRAALAGYHCVYVPSAVVLHSYDFRFSAKKCFLQERNRYYSLLKTLRWPTLVVMLPALLLSEAIAWSYAALQGPAHLRSKLRSYVWLLTNSGQIRKGRRQVQALRQVADRRVLEHFSSRINFTRTVNPRLAKLLTSVVNPVLYLLGRVSRAVVIW